MNRLCMLLAAIGIYCSTPPAFPGEPQQKDPNSSALSATAVQASADPAVVPEHLTVDGKAVGHRVESRDGEICLTCGKAISKDDVTYTVDGQRVPVHKGKCFGALAAHRAFSAGRDPLLWLVVGFLTNVLGYALLLVLPRQEVHALAGVPGGLGKVAVTYSPEVCPSCGAENHPSARACSGCGICVSVCPMDTLSFGPGVGRKDLVQIQTRKPEQQAAA